MLKVAYRCFYWLKYRSIYTIICSYVLTYITVYLDWTLKFSTGHKVSDDGGRRMQNQLITRFKNEINAGNTQKYDRNAVAKHFYLHSIQ